MNTTKERSCDGKKQYRNRKAAMKSLKRLERYKQADGLTVYRCLYGLHYHVGHKRQQLGEYIDKFIKGEKHVQTKI